MDGVIKPRDRPHIVRSVSLLGLTMPCGRADVTGTGLRGMGPNIAGPILRRMRIGPTGRYVGSQRLCFSFMT